MNQIDESEITILWHVGYHDGPINGVCNWRDNDYWFELTGDEMAETRTYNVIDIGSAAMIDEWAQHARFRYFVGHHTDHVDGLKGPTYAGRKNRGDWHDYYDGSYLHPDYRQLPVVGTFER